MEVMVSVPECLCMNTGAGLIAEDDEGVLIESIPMEAVRADLITSDAEGVLTVQEIDLDDDDREAWTDPLAPFAIYTFQCPRCDAAVKVGRGTSIWLDGVAVEGRSQVGIE